MHVRSQYLVRLKVFIRETGFFTTRKRSLGQGNIFQLSVILFIGGSAPVHAGIHPPDQRHTPTLHRADPPGADTPRSRPPRGDTPYCSASWETGNKRAVRILLECILVQSSVLFQGCAHFGEFLLFFT